MLDRTKRSLRTAGEKIRGRSFDLDISSLPRARARNFTLPFGDLTRARLEFAKGIRGLIAIDPLNPKVQTLLHRLPFFLRGPPPPAFICPPAAPSASACPVSLMCWNSLLREGNDSLQTLHLCPSPEIRARKRKEKRGQQKRAPERDQRPSKARTTTSGAPPPPLAVAFLAASFNRLFSFLLS